MWLGAALYQVNRNLGLNTCWTFPKAACPHITVATQTKQLAHFQQWLNTKLLNTCISLLLLIHYTLGNRKDCFHSTISHCYSKAIRKWLFTVCIHKRKPDFRQGILNKFTSRCTILTLKIWGIHLSMTATFYFCFT